MIFDNNKQDSAMKRRECTKQTFNLKKRPVSYLTKIKRHTPLAKAIGEMVCSLLLVSIFHTLLPLLRKMVSGIGT